MRAGKETLIESDERARGPLQLVALHGNVVVTVALPETGSVLIGRGDDADVRLDLPPISRRHARLHLDDQLQLEDLGSSNGTRVANMPLEPRERFPVRVGDPIEFGSVLVVLQPQPNAGAPLQGPRRVWGHDYFEARAEEESFRAHEEGRPFAVVRLRIPPPSDPATFLRSLGGAVRSADVIGAWGPGEYELLLMGHSQVDVERRIDLVRNQLPRALIGHAVWPRDGRTADILLECVATALRGRRDVTSAAPVIADHRMRALYELVPRIAQADISVLVLGETGVGKEVLAEGIHRGSPRATKPYLRLNCGAFTETLLESELFGHDKGAFTGASKARQGLLESADGGTVFLDEVAEMPLSIQVKLLRVIEQREVTRVGEVRPRKIDVRFISATNRNPEAEVRAGRFRQDLYFRLNGMTLEIPPLRERQSEIAPLAESFARMNAQRLGRPPPVISTEAMAVLLRYPWPGNVRELRNVIERAVVLAPDDVLTPEELPLEKISATVLSRRAAEDPEPVIESSPEEERARVQDALERCGGNQTVAAKLLGISRRTLVNRLDAFQMPRPRKRT